MSLVELLDVIFGNTVIKSILMALIIGLSFNASAKDYGTYVIEKSSIISVYDGDTFYIKIDGCPPVLCERLGVRIYGIDTPEKRSKCISEKELALQAKDVLSGLIKSGSVIELHNLQKGKYGRLLGYLYIDGVSYSDLIISKGLAVPYFGGKKNSWCSSDRTKIVL